MSEENPIDFNDAELEKASNLIVGLLESNWHGIQTAIFDTADGKVSVSINLTLKHLSADSRSCKAKLGYSVKNTDEAECFVRNPNQLDLIDEDGSDSIE